MEGEDRDIPSGGQTSGSNLEVSWADLFPRGQQTELASLGLPTNESKNHTGATEPPETEEHLQQRYMRMYFEGRLVGPGTAAREINSRDVSEIVRAIRPGDLLEIKSNGRTEYWGVNNDGTISNGVRSRGLREVLNEALKDPQAKIKRAPPVRRGIEV